MDAPEVHAPHGGHTGHRWLDIVLGSSALVVSCISLYIAVHHGQTMEKLVAANSWPNVTVSTNIEEPSAEFGKGVALSIYADNNGIGPGRLKTLQMWYGGVAVRSADDLGKLLKQVGGGQPLAVTLEGASVVGEVVGAKERRKMIGIATSDTDRWSDAFIKVGTGLETRVCYCSVFDECYVVDDRQKRKASTKVSACEAVSDGFNDDIGELYRSKRARAKPAASSP